MLISLPSNGHTSRFKISHKHVFLQIWTTSKYIWGYFSSFVGFWLDNRWLSHSRHHIYLDVKENRDSTVCSICLSFVNVSIIQSTLEICCFMNYQGHKIGWIEPNMASILIKIEQIAVKMKMLCYSFRKVVLVAAEASWFFSRRSIPGKRNPFPFISMEAAQSKFVISKSGYLLMSTQLQI